VLVPHIDYRVAPQVYAPGLLPLRNHPAELVIAVGTSHYWSDDAFILTSKDYQTPFGTVQTDKVMVALLAQTLPNVATTDVAHRPEHSLELHLTALKHLWAGKSFRVVPILVTPAACASPEILDQAVDALRSAIAASGVQAVWCISGDLAHVGRKFGDAQAAEHLIDSVRDADARLLAHLERADAHGYDAELAASDHQFRVCGYAPTMVALHALKPGRGDVTAYDIWHEAETASAVSFASVVFSD
jgi:AmmeMemoRadiSam system protein B